MKSNFTKLIVALGSWLFFFYFAYTNFMYCGLTPQSNPTTEGKIIQSKLSKSTLERRRGYTIDIIYEYYVNKKRFVSDRICCGASSNDLWKETINDYPVGKKVLVYYRDTRPEMSVIEPKIGRNGRVFLFLSLFLVILCNSILFLDQYSAIRFLLIFLGLFLLSSTIYCVIDPPINPDAALQSAFGKVALYIFGLLGMVLIILPLIPQKDNDGTK